MGGAPKSGYLVIWWSGYWVICSFGRLVIWSLVVWFLDRVIAETTNNQSPDNQITKSPDDQTTKCVGPRRIIFSAATPRKPATSAELR
jgi:hypothetical protein